MPRRALVLAVLLGSGAWVLALAEGFSWWGIFIGFAALFPGARLVGADGPRWSRRVVAVVALSALPGSMALGFTTLLPIDQRGGMRRYKDLVDQVLVVCRHAVPENEWPARRLSRIAFDRYGCLLLDGGNWTTLRRLAKNPPTPREDLRLYADRNTPWRSVLWLMATLEEAGIDRIHIAASAWADGHYRDEDKEILGLESGPAWPVRRIPVPLAAADSGDRALQVDIVAHREVARRWGDYRGALVMMPTRAKYRFRDRETDDLDELTGWLRKAASGRPFTIRVRAGNRTPLKFVVAAATAAFDAGANAWETGALPALPDEERDKVVFSYPERD